MRKSTKNSLKKQLDIFADVHPDIEAQLRKDGEKIRILQAEQRRKDKPILDALRLQAENDAAMIHALLKIDASGIE